MVRKSVIRMVKRFYHRLFVKENPELIKKRFINISFLTALTEMDRFVKKYFKNGNSTQLSIFLIAALGFKPKIPSRYGSSVNSEVEDFRNLIRSYSEALFNIIHESLHFRILVNNLFTSTMPNSDKK